jgi:hypothetical protein
VSTVDSYPTLPAGPGCTAGRDIGNRQQLIDSLAAVGDHDGVDLDPQKPHGGRYFDWSSRTSGIYQFETGVGDDAVVLEMNRADLTRLQQTLTLHLLLTDDDTDVDGA